MSVSGDTMVDEGLNALSWVHDELRRSLEAAHKALRRYLRAAADATDLDPVDPAILRQARAQLHQAVGAVDLVGLGPAGQVLHASEAALQRLSMRPKLITQAAVEAMERGSFAVLDYIGRRLVNKSVTALSLFPQYRVLQELAGATRIHPADLWPVSFSWRNLPADLTAPPREPDPQTVALVEGDLLAQMRGAPPSVSSRMSEVFAGLAAGILQKLPPAPMGEDLPDHFRARQLATLWQLAAAFYEAQADGLLKADVYSKRIGSRLLAQLRAGVEADVSERLAHDLLFFCSQAAPRVGVPVLGLGSGGRLRAVRQGYALVDEPVVDFEVPRLGRFDPAWVAQARKRVAAAKDLWSSVAGGDLSRLPGLAEQMALVSESLQRLYPDGGVLGRALQNAAQATANAQSEPPADLAMEVATALLYLDASLDDSDFDQPELSQRIHRLAQRIDQVRQKRDPGMLELWMEDLYRRVSDRQTMGNVVQELRATLSEVEKHIDQYFRNPAQRDVLIPVPAQLQAMRGVLSVLGLDQASQAVARMSEDVDALSDTEADPARAIASGSFDRLADNLGALSFLIDMVAVQPQMAKSLFRFDPASGSLSAIMARQERPSGFGEFDTGQDEVEPPPVSPDTDAVAVSLEFDRIVKQAKQQQRHGGDVIGGAGLPLMPAGDLLGDSALGMPDSDLGPSEPAAARPQVPPPVRGWPVGPAAGTSVVPLQPQPVPFSAPGFAGGSFPAPTSTPAPGAALTGSAAAPAPAVDQVDPEMRQVFLEEAREVLHAAREGLATLETVPADRPTITAVRRAFHTLKGSARMVGLKGFGEAAWACEQLFNARLVAEVPTTDPALRSFSQHAIGYFDRWVDALFDGDAAGFGPDEVVRGAQAVVDARLAPAVPVIPPAPLPAPAPSPVPVSTPSPLQLRVPDLPTADELDLPEMPTMPLDLTEQPLPPVAAPAPLLPSFQVFAPEALPVSVAEPPPPQAAAPWPAAEEDLPALEVSELSALPDELMPPLPEPGDALPAAAAVPDAVPDLAEAELPALLADPFATAPAAPTEPAQPMAAPDDLPPLDLAGLDDEVGASPLALEATLPLPVPAGWPRDALTEPAPADTAAAVELPEVLTPDLLLDAGDTVSPALAEPMRAESVYGEVDLPLDQPASAALPAEADGAEVDLPLDMAPLPLAVKPAQPKPRELQEGYKQIGPLRISLVLFNIFINEADDLSRELSEALTAWRASPRQPVGERAVTRAHSLAGSSGTVGYTGLSHLARTLEHALERAQLRGRAIGEEPELFVQASDEIRRLLHLFAAGFLNQPDPGLVQRLEVLAHTPVEDEAALLAASSPVPLDRPTGVSPLFQLSEFGGSGMAPLLSPAELQRNRPLGEEHGAAFDEEIDQTDVIDAELFAVFEEEALELLPRLHASLRDWSRRPGDQAPASAAMRSLHTFKGGARLAGAMRLGELAHRLETAIERLTTRQLQAAPADIETLMAHADVLDHQFDLVRGVPQATQLDGLSTLTASGLAPIVEPLAPVQPLASAGRPAAAAPLVTGLPMMMPPMAAEPTTARSVAAEPPVPAAATLPVPPLAPPVQLEAPAALSPAPAPMPAPTPAAAPAPVVVSMRQRPADRWSPLLDGEDNLPTAPSTFDEPVPFSAPMPLDEAPAPAARPSTPLPGLLDEPLPAAPVAPAAAAPSMPVAEPAAAEQAAVELVAPEPAAEPRLPTAAETAVPLATEPLPAQAVPALLSEPVPASVPAPVAAPLAVPAVTAAAMVLGMAVGDRQSPMPAEAAVAPAPVSEAPAPAPAEAPPAPPPAQPPAPAIDWARFIEAAPLPAEPPAVVRPATGSVRVRAAILDRLVGHSGEVSIARARIEADVHQFKAALGDLNDNLERLRAQLRDIELQAETQITSRLEAARAAQQQFDPLEMDRFTRFQELTRMMAESVSDVATVQRGLQRTLQSTEDTLAHQQRMSRDMQDDLLRTRLVEFEGLSERLYRVVRQAAKETGKPVRLDIVGGSIEVDRGVLDRMTPAFEHLLRNSVVHGIESAEQRAAAGKDLTGHITLTVGQIGNEVAVEVRDDGAGLHLDRIRERALASGLITEGAEPDQSELANLIFQPGFTTAQEVTEMAGRGVGMDVVRTEVNAIGGRIETASTAGKGTSFRLVLPLTTAVTQVVMLRCGEHAVAVPSTLVESVTRVPPDELDSYYQRGVARVAERELPFFWLDALLQGSTRGNSGGRNAPIVVIRSANRRVVLHVDEVLSNQEVVVKQLGPQLSRLPGLVGMTLLPSGRPALIYNPVPLATLYGGPAHERVQAQLRGVQPPEGLPDTTPARPKAPLVMVVDDSLTVRRVTQRLLEREGYRVQLAKDGQDALDRLSSELPQVILSDIEMPRMDGFDLLRSLRATPRLADVPVIMITSRLAQKHRDYAAELGANHYLGKPYAEDELLRLVGRYAPQQAASAA